MAGFKIIDDFIAVESSCHSFFILEKSNLLKESPPLMLKIFMKILIVTQKVDENNDVLGFFHEWIREFAIYCKQITVICLQKGEFDLPSNVKVLSLGKEVKQSRLKYVFNFFRYVWSERKQYDFVFVHMNPEYVILGGILWKILNKKIIFWYTHKTVGLKLRISEKLADKIFTASEKSFRLNSKKVEIIGHGINTKNFIPAIYEPDGNVILSVGRISPTKRQIEIIKIFRDVLTSAPDCKLYIVGSPILEIDKRYEKNLKNYVKKNDLDERIVFFGSVANKKMPNIFQQSKVLINLSMTGSLDKDVLEAMSCNVHIVTTNEAFKNVLPDKNTANDFAEIKNKILYFLKQPRYDVYRTIILEQHSLSNLVKKIISKLSK